MKMLKKSLLVCVAACTTSFAQINMPALSSAATVTQKIGIVDAKVEYSRPSARGRKVFGEVVKLNEMWRTGANSPTKVTFSDTVMIAGKKVAGGTYALYTMPSATEWTVILGKNPNAYAWDYKDGDEVVKLKTPVLAMNPIVETFTIDFANVTTKSSDLMISWDNVAVKFAISTDPDKKIMEEIEKKTANVDTYWNSANYYFDNGKDLKKALEWSNVVAEKNPQFWTVHLKAKILNKMGDCVGAQEAAKKSMELATVAKNDDYIKMNTKLIEGCPLPATPSTKKKK